ncbi:MAG: adenylate/guanylate cyclase domain-containing protein [Actinobacteria bacterium]|nr:MAG: adenylate/guanylate cyclase domain-containing protein [Actinomycetota bacterium]
MDRWASRRAARRRRGRDWASPTSSASPTRPTSSSWQMVVRRRCPGSTEPEAGTDLCRLDSAVREALRRTTSIGDRRLLLEGDHESTPDPVRGAEVAVALLHVASSDTGTPELRVGLATGPVLAREGDVFGSPVNLASRLVAIARPGSAVVSRSTRDALVDDDRFELSALPTKRLKGLGPVRAYRLRDSEPSVLNGSWS